MACTKKVNKKIKYAMKNNTPRQNQPIAIQPSTLPALASIP